MTRPAGPKLLQGLEEALSERHGRKVKQTQRNILSRHPFIEASFMTYILLSEELRQGELRKEEGKEGERGREGGAR